MPGRCFEPSFIRSFMISANTAMDFESLLRGYLDGTLSERELERFQSLIDRFPEYRSELLQTLEIRSALHDDALTLSPPALLVEQVRLSVAGAFAAEFSDRMLAEPEERRRGWLAPLRIAAGSFVAVCLAVGIALTPTISIDQSRASITPQAEATSGIALLQRSTPFPARTSGSDHASVKTGREETAVPVTLVSDISQPASVQSPVERIEEISPEIQTPTVEDPDALSVAPTRSLRHDIAALGEDVGASRPALDMQPSSIPLSVAEVTTPSIVPVRNERSEDQKERYRRLAIGVVVGSGQVAELKSLTALLQNSYYFSFGVNPHDRIGLEMGASAFERQERVPAPQSNGSFAKQSLGTPESGGKIKEDPGGQTQRQSATLVNRQYEQQITYGGVFYDRRIRVNSSWDLCGRVTFGGADNSIVGGVRAYAAYTPSSNRNITLTLGVGGSGLYNLTDRDNNTGGNYGIYYGIETGF